jgi:lysophospholipase L1-like esterase
MTFVGSALNFWNPELHWDVIHLNADGAVEFTAQLAKDVQQVLRTQTK